MNYFGRVYRLEIGLGDEIREFDGFPAADLEKAPAQIRFRIDQSPNTMHSTAEITLFGLSRTTRQGIYQRFDNVRLIAGYGGGYGVVFEGNVHNATIGRDGPESTTTLYCRSAADVWGEAYVNRSFGPGTPQIDIIRAVAETFGRSVEVFGDFDSLPRAIKGRTLSQDSKSALNELARSFDFEWMVEGQKTVIMKNGATRPDAEPFVYSAETGLIGSPELTDLGIDARVLLNPFIRPRDMFELRAETSTAAYSGIYDVDRALRPLGRFEVMSLVHEGDFYGDRWLTKITCRRPVT